MFIVWNLFPILKQNIGHNIKLIGVRVVLLVIRRDFTVGLIPC